MGNVLPAAHGEGSWVEEPPAGQAIAWLVGQEERLNDALRSTAAAAGWGLRGNSWGQLDPGERGRVGAVVFPFGEADPVAIGELVGHLREVCPRAKIFARNLVPAAEGFFRAVGAILLPPHAGAEEVFRIISAAG